MGVRSLLFAVALLAVPLRRWPRTMHRGVTGERDPDSARSSGPCAARRVSVTSDVVRIGDVIDNAGNAAQIAIYRAPDPGTTGTLPAAQVLDALRAHQVIGVDTKDMRNVAVTRLARTIEADDIELQDRASRSNTATGLATPRTCADLRQRRSGSAARRDEQRRDQPVRNPVRSAQRTLRRRARNRQRAGAAPARLRFTGTAVETVEAAVLARGVDRNDVLKFSDIVMERRPKAEVGNDAANRDRVIGDADAATDACRSGAARRRPEPSRTWCNATRP